MAESSSPSRQPQQQPQQQKIQQPTPQRLNVATAPRSILVSPRQKGNPVLACLKSLPWEYSDIPADYGLGLTTCALFLSLKYHRLHPEYIYTRIRNLQGRYNLRVLLTMVDIPNHEDSLRELSKTSLVNNVTLVLCWSAAEAARYLELYKSYEHANFAAIKGAQATTYAEKLVGFCTVPRAVNKADSIALVSNFGSLKAAINADPETIGVIGGWGEKKVKAWCKAVEEPFRVNRAAKRKLQSHVESAAGGGKRNLGDAVPISRVPLRDMAGRSSTPRSTSEGAAATGPAETAGGSATPAHSRDEQPQKFRIVDPSLDDDEDALFAAAIEESKQMAVLATAPPQKDNRRHPATDDELPDGIAAALARLRKAT